MKQILSIFFLIALCGAWASAQTPTPTPVDPLTAEKQRGDRLQARLNDFANLARYREANSKLAPPAKGEDRVVFMGDSITDFWKLDQYFPGQPYVNRGISGQTTPQMVLRFRADVIDLKPKVVVILAGTNDLSSYPGPNVIENTEKNLTSMVDLAHANGINVVLATVMPVSDYNKNAAGVQTIRTVLRPPAQINELNAWIKKYCAERNLVYLDYFTPMADEKGLLKADIANDGLHPNAKGYELIKPLAEAAIKSALKMRQK
ncbi:SGNH/GDSL hydrolase family protein [soil metagenome]